MISELEINNFKSIKSLKAQCKRINIFIGEPNAGNPIYSKRWGFYYSRNLLNMVHPI